MEWNRFHRVNGAGRVNRTAGAGKHQLTEQEEGVFNRSEFELESEVLGWLLFQF